MRGLLQCYCEIVGHVPDRGPRYVGYCNVIVREWALSQTEGRDAWVTNVIVKGS